MHWLHMDRLKEYGAIPVKQRYIEDGKIITSAEISYGIGRLAGLLASRTVAGAIQLAIKYDPDPPFDSGSPEKAPEDIVRLIRRKSWNAPGW